MKRALILFLFLLIFTLLIPLVTIVRQEKNSDTEELVTLFSSRITIDCSENTPLYSTYRAAD